MHTPLPKHGRGHIKECYYFGSLYTSGIGHVTPDTACRQLGMRGIKKCLTIIYRLKRYRDIGIPRYFVTVSIVDNFAKI